MSVLEDVPTYDVPDWQTKYTSFVQSVREAAIAKVGEEKYRRVLALAQQRDLQNMADWNKATAAFAGQPKSTPADYAAALVMAAPTAKTPEVKRRLLQEGKDLAEAFDAYKALKDTFDASYGDPKRAQAEFANRGDQMQGTLGAVLQQLSFPEFLKDYRDARKQAGDPQKAVRMTRLALGMQDLAESAGGAAAVRYQLGLPDMAAGEKLFREVSGKVPNAEAIKDKIVAFGEARHAYEDIAQNMETYAQQYVQAHPGTSYDEGIKAIQDVLRAAHPKVAELAGQLPKVGGFDAPFLVPPPPQPVATSRLGRAAQVIGGEATRGPIMGPIVRMLPEGTRERVQAAGNLLAPPQEQKYALGLIPTNYAASIAALTNALSFAGAGGLSVAGKAGGAVTGALVGRGLAGGAARAAGAATAGAVGAAEVPATIEQFAKGDVKGGLRNVAAGAALGGALSGAKTGLAGPGGRATLNLEATTPTVRARARALETTPPEVGQQVARRAEQLRAPVPQPRYTASRNYVEVQRQKATPTGPSSNVPSESLTPGAVEPPPTARPLTPPPPRSVSLPHELSSAKPRYSYGSKQFKVDFDSDVDRAAYIAAQVKKRSKRDAQYVAFGRQQTGMSEAQFREYGQRVRSTIKEQARISPSGATLRIPAQGVAPKAGAVEPGAQVVSPPKPPSAAPAKPAPTQQAELARSEAQKVLEEMRAEKPRPVATSIRKGTAERTLVPPTPEQAAAAKALNKALKKGVKPPVEPPVAKPPVGLPPESVAKMQEKIAALKTEKATKPKLKPPSEKVVYRIDYESAEGGRKIREFASKEEATRWVTRGDLYDVKLNKAAADLRDELAAQRESARVAAETAREAEYQRSAKLRAAVNEKVDATKFKRETINVSWGGGKPRPVTGPSLGGLIVQKHGEGKYAKYGVTHMGSGKKILPGIYETQWQAKTALVRLQNVTDWTKPEADVLKAVTKEVYQQKISPLINDVYADIEQTTPAPKPGPKPPRKPKAKSLGAAAYQRGMGGVGIPPHLVGQGEVVVKTRPPKGTRFINPPPPLEPPSTLRHKVAEVAGIPREVMTTLDIGAVGRQGLPLVLSHPIKAARVFGPALRDMAKEKTFAALPEEIRSHRNYEAYRKMDLALPVLHGASQGISAQEERFATGLFQRFLLGETKVSPRGIPVIGKAAKVAGELMHGSKRFHESFLSRLRTSVADGMVESAEKIAARDKNYNWDKFYKRAGRFVNAWSGRGNLGSFEEAAGDLSTSLWSPRLLASHAQRLNPLEYVRMDKVTRGEAIRANLAIAGTVSTIGAMVKLYRESLPPSERDQVDFGLDPLSSDYGKLRIGKTRIDFTGGHGQYIRTLAQIFSGKTVSSTTGRKKDTTFSEVIGRFGQGKVSPAMGYARDVGLAMRGHFTKKMPTDFDGRPISIPRKTLDLFTSMVIQNVQEIVKTDPSLLPLSVFDIAGFSTNTYPTNTTRAIDSAARLIAARENKRDEERKAGKVTTELTKEQKKFGKAWLVYRKALKDGAPKAVIEQAKLAADTAARRVLGKEGWD